MNNESKIDKIEAAFKQHFAARPSIFVPGAEWDNHLLAMLKPLDRNTAELHIIKFEKNIWRFAWVSFAATAAAMLIFIGIMYSRSTPSDRNSDLGEGVYRQMLASLEY